MLTGHLDKNVKVGFFNTKNLYIYAEILCKTGRKCIFIQSDRRFIWQNSVLFLRTKLTSGLEVNFV